MNKATANREHNLDSPHDHSMGPVGLLDQWRAMIIMKDNVHCSCQ